MSLPTDLIEPNNNILEMDWLILGQPKSGKSRVANTFPGKVLFLDIDGGLKNIKHYGIEIKSTLDMDAAIADLKKPHDFRYVVVDTVDKLWHLACKTVVRTHNQTAKTKARSVSDIGVGSGWLQASDMVMSYINKLKHLKGVNVILITHSLSINTKKIGEDAVYKESVTLAGKLANRVLGEMDIVIHMENCAISLKNSLVQNMSSRVRFKKQTYKNLKEMIDEFRPTK